MLSVGRREAVGNNLIFLVLDEESRKASKHSLCDPLDSGQAPVVSVYMKLTQMEQETQSDHCFQLCGLGESFRLPSLVKPAGNIICPQGLYTEVLPVGDANIVTAPLSSNDLRCCSPYYYSVEAF